MTEENKSIGKFPNLRFPGFEGDWEEKKLGEVADIGRGKSKHRPRDAEFLFGGKYPFIQTGDVRKADLYLTDFTQTYSEAGLLQSKLWDEDTLCITIAANIAETSILKIKACFPDSIIGLLPKENKTIVLFVKYLFDKFKIEIQNLSQGAAQDNLNQDKLSKIEFAFPNIEEQKKISSFIFSIDSRIQTQKKIIEQLETLMKATREKVFSQKLRFKDEYGNYFSDWKTIKLDEICDIKKGEQLNKEDLTDTGNYPCLNGGMSFSGYTDKFNSDKNTITISEGGNSCGFVSFMKSKFWLGGHCYKIITKRDISTKFLFHLLKFYEKEIMNLRVGSGLPNIQQKDLKNLQLIFSNDIEEQTKIANFLSSIQEKIETEKQILEKLELQKKFLLANLFV
ncbi:restriction endonuclease subunit S [Chryseobacterium sp. MMO-72]|uniref:restriction endonuclease subunit S n=2 Tax=unclassified Chryseobacterium TaxID=2593645 RepID=UPI00301A9AFA